MVIFQQNTRAITNKSHRAVIRLFNELQVKALVRALKIFKPGIFEKRVTVFTNNATRLSFGSRLCNNFLKRELNEVLDISLKIEFVPQKANVLLVAILV